MKSETISPTKSQLKSTTRSTAWFDRARATLPGGVNSPVRAFKSVGGSPLFIQRASGSRMWDVDGNEYIDYIGSWGPMILGHGHPAVRAALARAVESGTSFGAPSPPEVELAEEIVRRVPSMEKVRFVNSGTEATMSAIRLARAVTKRDVIVKFSGGYHGHADSFLIAAGSGAATLGLPDSPGVTAGAARDTRSAIYNDLESVQRIFADASCKVAAVIVEPVAGNMGVVPPIPGFLEGLRELCTQHGAILIFDEVMTGFRVAYGGAQDLYGIKPDLTTLGKIIGGGLPVGAYGGRADLMSQIAPEGAVYQAGTLSGNPLAMAAGLATLRELTRERYTQLNRSSQTLAEGLRKAARDTNTVALVQDVGSMLTLFFTDNAIRDYDAACQADHARFRRFFHGMLTRGVHLPPSGYEAWFVSLAHDTADIDLTLQAARESLMDT